MLGDNILMDNPAIPYGMLIPDRIDERISKLRKTLYRYGFEDEDISRSTLSRLVLKCMELENPIKDRLEKIAYNFITSIFGVPYDSVDISLSITDKIDESEFTVNVDSIGGDMGASDFEMSNKLKSLIDKRMLLNAISMGAGILAAENVEAYAREISELNEELPDVYRMILVLDSYLLYKTHIEINDRERHQSGCVNVMLGNPGDKPVVFAQGNILPVLICEAVRGFMELFASHGLPKDKKAAQMLIGYSDYLKAEPDEMRFGPVLFGTILSYVEDESLMPYIIMRLSMLGTNDFNAIMNQVLADTEEGERLMSEIEGMARNDAESDGNIRQNDGEKENDEFLIVDKVGDIYI